MAERWPAVLLLVSLMLLAWAGMAWGWRRRAGRQSDVAAPAGPPTSLTEPIVTVEGLYVGSVMAGQWLDRVVPHGLGARANADLSVFGEGVLLQRNGTEPVWIPGEDLVATRRDTGLAGKVTETGGLVVWTWSLGGTLLESGIRPRYSRDTGPLLRALESVTQEAT